jgi:hypothetical protein
MYRMLSSDFEASNPAAFSLLSHDHSCRDKQTHPLANHVTSGVILAHLIHLCAPGTPDEEAVLVCQGGRSAANEALTAWILLLTLLPLFAGLVSGLKVLLS